MRCPVCKAEVDQPSCRRCKADLSMLVKLEQQRQRALFLAAQCYAQGQVGRGLAYANGADALHHDEDSARMLAVGQALLGNFAKALEFYQVRQQLLASEQGPAPRT